MVMDASEVLAGMTPDMPKWDEFIEGIRLSRQELAEHRAAGKPGYPPGWISVEEFRRLRALSPAAE
jgi:hypothetical protein